MVAQANQLEKWSRTPFSHPRLGSLVEEHLKASGLISNLGTGTRTGMKEEERLEDLMMELKVIQILRSTSCNRAEAWT